MRFFTISLGFGPRFGAKIGEKSAFELEDLDKRKTLKNIGRDSKNQGSGFQKTMPNHRKNASERDFEKDWQQKRENNDFRRSRGSFWEPKTAVFRRFFEILRSLFCDAMQTARKSARLGGPQRFATVSLVLQRIRSA